MLRANATVCWADEVLKCGWGLHVWWGGGGWSGDSGKTLEVAHPIGLALDADSAVALALEDVRSLCVGVCAWAALLGWRHWNGSHHDRVNKEGEHWHWHHSTSDDRSIHTHTSSHMSVRLVQTHSDKVKQEHRQLISGTKSLWMDLRFGHKHVKISEWHVNTATCGMGLISNGYWFFFSSMLTSWSCSNKDGAYKVVHYETASRPHK